MLMLSEEELHWLAGRIPDAERSAKGGPPPSRISANGTPRPQSESCQTSPCCIQASMSWIWL